ncbi:MAG: hypothetical protein HYX95_03490 [Chloroflexi bacterium]|nr:hypothetical protein [Chloroflexota bacterium]
MMKRLDRVEAAFRVTARPPIFVIISVEGDKPLDGDVLARAERELTERERTYTPSRPFYILDWRDGLLTATISGREYSWS